MSACRLFHALAFVFLLPGWGQTPSTGWRELLQHATQHNQELLAIQQEIGEARGAFRQAGLRPAPALEISGATGRPLLTKGEEQFGAAFSQTLEAGGKRSSRVAVASHEIALAEARYGEGLRQLRFQLRTRYAEYVSQAERLAIAEEVLRSWRQSLDLMTLRVEQGDAAVLERDLLRVELARTRAEQARIQGSLEEARLDLAVLATYDDPRQVPAPEAGPQTGPAISLEELRAGALAQRPDLRIANIIERQAEAGIDLAKAEGKPDWTLSAGYSRVYSRFDNQLGVDPTGGLATLRDRDDLLMAGISVPLFSRSRNQGNLEAASARHRGSRHRARALEKSIPLQVEAAWNQYTSAREAHQLLSEQVLGQSGNNLRVMQQAYELGHLHMLDVLNEQRRLYSIRMEAVDLRLRMMQALAALEFAYAGELQ